MYILLFYMVLIFDFKIVPTMVFMYFILSILYNASLFKLDGDNSFFFFFNKFLIHTVYCTNS